MRAGVNCGSFIRACAPMSYLHPPSIPSLEIAGRPERFAARRVYCVGWNYAEHVREMGADPEREPPVFFMKPPDALVPNGGEISYPPATGNLHYEIELVVAIGAAGADISAADAAAFIFGYAVGLDMTRRDLQARLVVQGHRVRVYVPFGREWFPYFMRRLGERPANVLFVLRSLFHEGRG